VTDRIGRVCKNQVASRGAVDHLFEVACFQFCFLQQLGQTFEIVCFKDDTISRAARYIELSLAVDTVYPVETGPIQVNEAGGFFRKGFRSRRPDGVIVGVRMLLCVVL